MHRHVPNSITGLRLILSVVFFVLLNWYQYEGRGDPTLLNVAFVVYAVALFTDFLDGYLARRRRQVTWFGKLLEPIAAKLHPSAAFISLVQLALAPAWMVALIICREFAVTALRSLAYAKGITIPASSLGKFKMASQVTAILLLILAGGPMPFLATPGYIVLWAVMALAVVSAVDYYRRFQLMVNAHVTDVNVARERRAG
jgi:CDP-diacylglycerol--glycerol-3-phosphate 3-phosphatidyltransferase